MLTISNEGFKNEAYNASGAELFELNIIPEAKEQHVSAILYQNAPNPFSSATSIRFYLPQSSSVDIIVIDMQGHIQYRLDGSYSAGMHEIPLALAKNLTGPGVYFCKLIVGKDQLTNKMVLIE
jgi:hypothetical protein